MSKIQPTKRTTGVGDILAEDCLSISLFTLGKKGKKIVKYKIQK